MIERRYETASGAIRYWRSRCEGAATLVFLPGLTADRRLFERQIAFFEGRCGLLVWDCLLYTSRCV